MGLKLMAEMGLDGSGINRGINSIRQNISNLAATIGAAFSVGAVTALAKKTIEFAGHITDLSARLGVTTDYLQEMQFVMKQNGGSVDDLTSAFEKLGEARIAALSGDEKMAANFAKFGIGIDRLKSSSSQDLMDAIAGQFKTLGNNDEIKTAFKEIGGKAAGALVPAFVDGLEDGRASARKAGAVASQDAIAQLDEIGDSFDRLSMVLTIQLAPAILAVAQAAKQLVAGTQGLGSFWGAATANISLANLEKAIGSGKNPVDVIKNIAGLFSSAAGTEAEMGAINDYLSTEAAAKSARAARIANQNRPQDVPNITPKLTKTAAAKAFSDSLLSVGNFLGSGRSTLETVAQKQLKLTERMVASLDKIANKTETAGTIKVP